MREGEYVISPDEKSSSKRCAATALPVRG